MYNKIVLLSAVLCVFHLAAMDVVVTSDETVTLEVQGKQIELPVRHVKLLGVLHDSFEDYQSRVFPLPNVDLDIWHLIESQLERVYRIELDASTAEELKQEVTNAFTKLDGYQLQGVMRAADYLAIPLMFEIAVDVAKHGALLNLSFEQLSGLPENTRNIIIMNTVFNVLCPVSVDEQVLFGSSLVMPSLFGDYLNLFNYSIMNRLVFASRRRLGYSWITCASVNKDDKIVAGDETGMIRVFDLKGKQLEVFEGDHKLIDSILVSKDDKIVMKGHCGKSLQVYDMQGNHYAGFWKRSNGEAFSMYLTNSDKVVLLYRDSVEVYDMQANLLASIRYDHERFYDRTATCVTHDNMIVAGHENGMISLWNMRGFQCALWGAEEYEGEGSVTSLCAREDGKILAGYSSGIIRIWDREGNKLAECKGHKESVDFVGAAAQGLIASGSSDGTVRVWDEQGNHLMTCTGHRARVNSVFVTKDGTIVSQSHDGVIRVWERILLPYLIAPNEEQSQMIWNLLTRTPLDDKSKQECWQQIIKVLSEVEDSSCTIL